MSSTEVDAAASPAPPPSDDAPSSDHALAAAEESGVAEALNEARAQQAAEQEREAKERDSDGQPQEQQRYDLGEEFGLGSLKQQLQRQQNSNSTSSHRASSSSSPTTQSSSDPASRTFLTGVDNVSQSSAEQQQRTAPQPHQTRHSPSSTTDQEESGMSDEEMIRHVESQMLEYERSARYLEAEKARQHLESLKKKFSLRRRDDLDRVQAEDVKVFYAMVAQHQQNFDAMWSQKALEHKLRADELIEALKWKHEDAQRQLYESLRKKRMAKFSVELLNMRSRQVMLAKAKNYLAAEKVKRKADLLESIEIDRIRSTAKEENAARFATLLKKQEWERRQLASKLAIEKRCLLEAKAQDFIRLKKRLRNAEQELRKQHVRQQLLAEKKLLPLYSFNPAAAAAAATHAQDGMDGSNNTNGGSLTARSARGRSTVLRNSGMQRMMMNGSATSRSASSSSSSSRRHPSSSTTTTAPPPLKSARQLTRGGSNTSRDNRSSYDSKAQMQSSLRTGQSIVGDPESGGSSSARRPARSGSRVKEEKEWTY